MIQIQFLDVNGVEINPGDWLKVRCTSFGDMVTVFYAQFKISDDHIVPHDTFAWDSLEKINFEDIPMNQCSQGEGGYYYQYEKEEAKESGHRLHFVIGLGEIRERTKSFIIKEVKSAQ